MNIETLKPFLYWGGLVAFLLLELRASYRPSTVSKTKRWITNLSFTVVNGILYYQIFFAPITALLLLTQEMQLGLLYAFSLPYWLHIVFSILILDFFIYVWHLLNHKVPLLWRFHRVHHSDINMDASTASRFHLGELLLSGLVRLAVIYTFGVPLPAYILFEIFVNISIQFHHSSISINPAFEKIWIWLFIPPSMHRVHHSVKIAERDSNYGVIFSWWDRIMGTFTWGIDQSRIIIGIGSHRDFSKLGFWHIWLMPFTRQSR
jgi:sterol desaturase/sphingolipid hydroxylase (fatty acid hydroxylase superfamily)